MLTGSQVVIADPVSTDDNRVSKGFGPSRL